MKKQTNDSFSGHQNRPKPFLKWVGGKTQLLPALSSYLPQNISCYCEPFLGGGALFFFLRGQRRLTGTVALADINRELINAYRIVQNDVENLITRLERHQQLHCREYFLEMRSLPFTEDVEGAARMIYLNKTCFNGLYRVNADGHFNVPPGEYEQPLICDKTTLYQSAAALQGVTLTVQSFEQSLSVCPPGSFLYLDPPYVPLSRTASFTGYQAQGFHAANQERLASCIHQCHERGVEFVLSNSMTDQVLKLYSRYTIQTVMAKRRVNCDAEKRGLLAEAIITNAGIDRPDL